MKKNVVFMVLIFCLSAFCQCDRSQNRLGVSLGIIQCISYQHYFTEKLTFDAVAAIYRCDPVLYVCCQYYTPYLLSDPLLRSVFAAGAHIGYFNGYENTKWFMDDLDQQENYLIQGLDLQVGIDYDFTEFPVNLILDYRPAYNIVNHVGHWYGIALTVRYVFR